jgi:hypothetical protein
VPGNYDNTGKDEFAVFRPSTGQWIIGGPNGTYTITLGQTGDIPVPGAYDSTTATRATEAAVFRPSTGQYIIHSNNGNRTLQFKVGDIPAPGDYEGTGVTEAAVFRNSTANWYVMNNTTDTAPRKIAVFGWAGNDVPPNTPYQFRALKPTGIITKTGSASGTPVGGSSTAGATTVSNGNGTTNSLTPPAAAPPKSVALHGRHRPNQGHAKAQGNLTKHPLLSTNRIPATAAKAVKKGPGVKA